jgi:hypothetical protein
VFQENRVNLIFESSVRIFVSTGFFSDDVVAVFGVVAICIVIISVDKFLPIMICR